MKQIRWQVLLAVSLIALSVAFYGTQVAIFRTPRETFFYILQDLAFVPIQVLLVTLIIDRLLKVREKRSRLEKLNMIIGAFFSEAGTRLLAYLSKGDPELERIREDLVVTNDWSDQEFMRISKRLRNYRYGIEAGMIDLSYLKDFLAQRREFLLLLLENPNLLEHESFTELLLAVFHLLEELVCREDLSRLPLSDVTHIAGDAKRVYGLLVLEWLDYLKHLKDNYPYLFSLAIRLNPFDKNASPVVTA